MPIITISRCSYTHGKNIAEAVAKALDYTCISREELLNASQEFNMPGMKFVRELPIILDQTVFNKHRYISYIRSALLKHLAKGKVVYHGFCGHILLKDIDHVLKVQITAELEDRVKIVMDRDGFSRNDALLFIKTMDDARKKWCQKLYKIDLSKICQYDISLNISKFPLDQAVDVICKTAMLDRFKTTPESRRAMIELLCTADARTETLTDSEADRICSIASLMKV
ncbi:MAG: cytidylate kinase-like family protein [Desulfobacterales bacterium]|jgi:cytidylate kinase